MTRSPMSRVVSFIALVLVFVLTPGMAEFAENAAHIVAEGHGAHAFDDAEHEPMGDEHGCSGTFHVCSCHASPTFIVGQGSLGVCVPLPSTASHQTDARSQLTIGHDLGVFRPPNAQDHIS